MQQWEREGGTQWPWVSLVIVWIWKDAERDQSRMTLVSRFGKWVNSGTIHLEKEYRESWFGQKYERGRHV